VRAAESAADGHTNGVSALGLAVVKAQLLRARGEFREALDLLQTAADIADGEPAWLTRELTLAQARLVITMGRRAASH